MVIQKHSQICCNVVLRMVAYIRFQSFIFDNKKLNFSSLLSSSGSYTCGLPVATLHSWEGLTGSPEKCLEAVWTLVLAEDFVMKAQNWKWRDPLLPAVCCPVSSGNLLTVSNKFFKTGITSLPCLLGVAWGEIWLHRCKRHWSSVQTPSAPQPQTQRQAYFCFGIVEGRSN